MDLLLKRLRESECGVHVWGTYMGGAIHADDLRTTGSSSNSIYKQGELINSFASDFCLKLNTTKCEVVKISPYSHDMTEVQIGNSSITTWNVSKCVGVWWNSSLSAKNSVSDKINKPRSFFALGRLGAFEGDLNPLIFLQYLPCIIPTLFYGSKIYSTSPPMP